MKYGEIPGVKKPVSRVAQGSMMLGRERLDESFALLDAMFEAGINMLDTANCYGEDNERIPGEWCASRDVRDDFIMLAKGAHPDAEGSRCYPEAITEELRLSLDRMGFDYIDLYVLHRDDTSVPVAELVDCLSEHVDAGRIHAFGGSNWTYERLKEANEYAAANGRTPFAVSSPNFSLAIQYKPVWDDCLTLAGPDQADARAWYAETNMPLVTWSSTARGFFSGRVTSANYKEKEDLFWQCDRDAFWYPDNFRRLDRAYELAEAKGISVVEVAVAYVLNYPLNTFPLVGSATPEELRVNAAAVDIELTPDEMAWLNLERDDR